MHIYSAQKLEPTQVHAGCIYLFENAVQDPTSLIATIEDVVKDPNIKNTWLPAFIHSPSTNAPEFTSSRSNYHLSLTGLSYENEFIRLLNNSIAELMMRAAVNYAFNMRINEGIFFKEEINVLRYQTGQEYKSHYDGATSSGRAISPILYLNDEYEGGEIEFVHQNYTLKPKAGTLAIFPANYAFSHIAHPVTSGTKYAMVTWLHDRP
jgi:Rps23 Pro-64 3,4-dihydroxylase Tpa1-like proline 4-hydroxylase